MISNDIVFVLGAGASKPYEFPTAGELRSDIIKDIKHHAQPGHGIKSQVEEVLEWLKYDQNRIRRPYTWADFEAFAEDFERSGITSIDAFLEARQEYEEVGKIALALELIPNEDPGDLFDHRKDDWYEWLINQLYRGPDEGVVSGKVRVITFNYDRSLEKRFIGALSSRFDIGRGEALDRFENMVDVIHVYGSLGDMRESSDSFREFAPNDDNPKDVLTAARGVRLMYEVQRSDAEQDFQEWFEWADKICFLGFGFHEENLDLLGIRDITKNSNNDIFGTIYGLDEIKRRYVRKLLREIDHQGGGISLGRSKLEGKKSLNYLKSQPPLII